MASPEIVADFVKAFHTDQKRGAFFGGAIGDALGAPVEFRDPGTFELVTDYRAGGPFDLEAGSWTDDTSMALALADSLANGFDLDDQIKKYIAWWETGKYSVNGTCFDIGCTTRCALEAYNYHKNVLKCASKEPESSGNGSIMRLSPIPIKYADYTAAEVMEFAAQSSMTTHASKQCLSACRYMSLIMWGIFQGELKETVLSTEWAMKHLENGSYLGNKLELDKNIQQLVEGSFKRKSPPEIKGSGWVVQSLEAALWAFYTSNSFEETVLKAVNLGDDADSTAAVAGQIAGAEYGEDGIPDKWRKNLKEYNMLNDVLVKIL